jgi:hypothetical protein
MSSFTDLNENISQLNDEEIIRITSCPSINEILPLFSVIKEHITEKCLSMIFLNFKFDQVLENLSEWHFHKIYGQLCSLEISFAIIFESSLDNSCEILWKSLSKNGTFKLKIEANECEAGNFVADSIFKSFKFGRNRNGEKF